VKFVLDGTEHELTAEQVRERLSGVLPARVRHQGVRVDRQVFPLKQAFEVAAGVRRDDFTTQTARRHFSALGFELVGDVDPRESSLPEQEPAAPAAPAIDEWQTDTSAEARLIEHLVGEGWQIEPDQPEQGVDLLATRDGASLALHVKGYPSRRNVPASPRAGRRPPAPAGTQAGHWYAQAVLAAMRTRSRLPQAQAVIALPHVERYRELYAETAGSLNLSGIDVWWIGEDGQVATS
jgi:hypothetical protein